MSQQFDPMTGKPIMEEQARFDPMTGKPIKTSGNKKIPMILAGVAIVIIAIVICVSNGVFLSKQNKILLATANTFNTKGKLAKAVEALEVLQTDNYTLALSVSSEGQGFDATLAAKKSKMELSGKLDIDYYPELGCVIGIDSKKVYGKIEGLDDIVFEYAYKQENDGALMEQIDEETIEIINEALENFSSPKKQKAVADDMTDAILKELKEWDISKTEKEKFEIGGKTRNCAGYTIIITEDNVMDMIDAMEEVSNKYAESNTDVLEDYYDDIKDSFDGMDDVEMNVYLHSNKLAAITFEVYGEDCGIVFTGGKSSIPSFVVEVDDEEVMELKSEAKGSEEEYTLFGYGDEVATLTYDSKSGDLVGEFDYGYDEFCIEANLKGNGNEMVFKLESLEEDGYRADIDLELTIKKGAKIQNLSGEKFDIGKATEDEWEDLMEDFEDEIEDLFY